MLSKEQKKKPMVVQAIGFFKKALRRT